ncbi:hypothetical protein CRUP_028750 [Coryphaenoides rupestris]|nr:hypothetical protein CRUP_028750 [Coryphaenoides rupestris]
MKMMKKRRMMMMIKKMMMMMMMKQFLPDRRRARGEAVLGSPGVSGRLPKPENLRWLSTNFKTLLTWGPEAEEHTYSVQYAE